MTTDKPDLSRLRIDRSPDSPHGRAHKAKAWIFGIVIGIVVVPVLIYRTFFLPVSVQATSAVSIRASQLMSLLNASGYVVAERRAAVASKATGRLVYLAVEEGTRVKKGQVLARLENADAEAGLAESKARLERSRAEAIEAKANFERRKLLFAEGLISHADYDAAMARNTAAAASLAAAAAVVRAAEIQLDYTYIRAPFDGTILTKDADIGEIVAPFGSSAHAKAAVVTMADMDSILVEVDVSESNVEKVSRGLPCEITLDAFPEAHYFGVVHMLVPTADRAKATVLTKVRFLDRDDRVLPEMSAKVAFLPREFKQSDNLPKIVVESSAIFSRDGKEFVYKIEDGIARETSVMIGASEGDRVEIVSGLAPGDPVVLKPSRKIQDGASVRLIKP